MSENEIKNNKLFLKINKINNNYKKLVLQKIEETPILYKQLKEEIKLNKNELINNNKIDLVNFILTC
jgi:phage host-nuclease inhibitor protein Gam